MGQLQKNRASNTKSKRSQNPFLVWDFLSPDFHNSLKIGQSCTGVIMSILFIALLICLSILLLRQDIYKGIQYTINTDKLRIDSTLNVTIGLVDLGNTGNDYSEYLQIIGKNAQSPCSQQIQNKQNKAIIDVSKCLIYEEIHIVHCQNPIFNAPGKSCSSDKQSKTAYLQNILYDINVNGIQVDQNLLVNNNQAQKYFIQNDITLLQTKTVDPGYLSGAIDRFLFTDTTVLNKKDRQYNYKFLKYQYQFISSKSLYLPQTILQSPILLNQKFNVNKIGSLLFKDYLEFPTFIINNISLVMGVYYFLWIFLSEILIAPLAFHFKTLDQIGRYDKATQRSPNACLSFLCCCGPSRSTFLNQKQLIDDNTDPITIANNLNRLLINHVQLTNIVDPYQTNIQHLKCSDHEVDEDIQSNLSDTIVEFMEIKALVRSTKLKHKIFKAIKKEGLRRKKAFQKKVWRWGDQAAAPLLMQNVGLVDSMIDHLDLKFELEQQDQKRPSVLQRGFKLDLNRQANSNTGVIKSNTPRDPQNSNPHIQGFADFQKRNSTRLEKAIPQESNTSKKTWNFPSNAIIEKPEENGQHNGFVQSQIRKKKTISKTKTVSKDPVVREVPRNPIQQELDLGTGRNIGKTNKYYPQKLKKVMPPLKQKNKSDIQFSNIIPINNKRKSKEKNAQQVIAGVNNQIAGVQLHISEIEQEKQSLSNFVALVSNRGKDSLQVNTNLNFKDNQGDLISNINSLKNSVQIKDAESTKRQVRNTNRRESNLNPLADMSDSYDIRQDSDSFNPNLSRDAPINHILQQIQPGYAKDKGSLS